MKQAHRKRRGFDPPVLEPRAAVGTMGRSGANDVSGSVHLCVWCPYSDVCRVDFLIKIRIYEHILTQHTSSEAVR